VGNGYQFSFGGHKSCGESELKSVFPNLDSISCEKEMTVQLCGPHVGKGHRDLRFRRNLWDWEMEEFQCRIEFLYIGTMFLVTLLTCGDGMGVGMVCLLSNHIIRAC